MYVVTITLNADSDDSNDWNQAGNRCTARHSFAVVRRRYAQVVTGAIQHNSHRTIRPDERWQTGES